MTAQGFDHTKRKTVEITSLRKEAPAEFEESLVLQAQMKFDRNPLPWERRSQELVTVTKPQLYFGSKQEASIHRTVGHSFLSC